MYEAGTSLHRERCKLSWGLTGLDALWLAFQEGEPCPEQSAYGTGWGTSTCPSNSGRSLREGVACRKGEPPTQWLVSVSSSIELSQTCRVSIAELPKEGRKGASGVF